MNIQFQFCNMSLKMARQSTFMEGLGAGGETNGDGLMGIFNPT